jgi:ABC-type Fe3+/spermidine/putrescine transport system ATPase subunit
VKSVPYVEAVDLHHSRGERAILDGFCLNVHEREFIALFGKSGSGKTTILRLVAGLDAPDSGEIWLSGELASESGRILIPPRQRKIGFVFQDLALWPHMTVAESLEFVLRSTGINANKRRERISEVLSAAHIPDLGDRYPHQLSGGEQQRAAIARALAPSPRLLLLDEPMSSLDAELKAKLGAELGSTHRTLGLTIIYVTHDLSEVRDQVGRVISL